MRLQPCSLATACVPWHADDSFMEDTFRRGVRNLLASGFSNLYIFGTAGEGYAVTDAQFRQIAEVFREEMHESPGLCQLGVIGLSVPQVKARIEMGLSMGFMDFQISLPSWGVLNDREMHAYFESILGSYPQARFLHYNLLRGLRIVTGLEYARLAADHPNLVATKSGRGMLHHDLELLTQAPDLCHFFTELDYAYASAFAPCGLLVSLTAINAGKAMRLFEAGQHGNLDCLRLLTRECKDVSSICCCPPSPAGSIWTGRTTRCSPGWPTRHSPCGSSRPTRGRLSMNMPHSFPAYRRHCRNGFPDDR